MTTEAAAAPLVGAHLPVPCLDGVERPYRDLDCAASTPALQTVADRVAEFLPWYSSVHRGAGYKSRRATAAYEAARDSVHRFAGRPTDGDDVVVLVRNTTEAINHLAYRLRLGPTTWWPRPWSSTTPTCCPGRGWQRGAGSSAAPTARSTRPTWSGCSTTGGGRRCWP